MILLTAGLVVTKNNQLLLAYSNNKNAWYLPEGKVDKVGNPVKHLSEKFGKN